MRAYTTGLFNELTTEGGSKTVSITPGAAQQTGKFLISGIAPRIPTGDRNYLTRLWLHLLTTLDPDAAGNAVNWDKLPKGLASVQVFSRVFGTCYPHNQTRGAVLAHVIQVIGLGYAYPEGARTQIPASTDVDVTLDLFFAVPFAHECLDDPMETAQWAGFFDGGTVEMTVAASTVYDGDYAGAVIKTPTTLRCVAETQPSPKNFIGVPFQWRERQISGGGSSPQLTNVGGETELNGISPGAGLAALLWLTNATGIGLDGPDGVDNFTSISLPWRGQQQILNLDGYFNALRVLQERRVGPVAGVGATIIADRAGWPTTMAVTTGADNRPSANAEQMLLPMVAPGRHLKTSKVQRLLGNLPVEFGLTAAITTTHRFVSWELLEFTEMQIAKLAALGNFRGPGSRRDPGGRGSAKELRYTAIEFDAE